MTDVVLPTDAKQAAQFILSGRVQGLGVRPAIARLATEFGLTGRVSNQSDGVRVHVEGETAALESFADQLANALPAAAELQTLGRTDVAAINCVAFEIERGAASGRLATAVPRDLPVCEDCLREIADTHDRRHSYAFTSCTNCGPRFSIIYQMPYERSDSTMSNFVLCPQCRDEFTAPANRRFHAQTNACPDCGPLLTAVACHGDGDDSAIQLATVEQAAAVLIDGGIVALKGLGGFQLVCDATSTSAVEQLRKRKHRSAKPLAVMLNLRFADLFTEADRAAFFDPANPIVILSPESTVRLHAGPEPTDRKTTHWPLVTDLTAGRVPLTETPDEFCDDVVAMLAPGINTLGVFRPTTPLHALLIETTGRPLVVTSGNADGEPLAFEDNTAALDLVSIADLILQHNRRIIRPIDDSVVRIIAGRPVTIRAARGIAPLPLPVEATRPLLAVGGHQKSAIALCNGSQSILGPHIGDLNSLATRERFVQQTRHLLDLYRTVPDAVVCDLNPDYFTTRWAERWAAEAELPAIRVQHHHAHIAAAMLEHGWLSQTVLGVAFDGTGYGTDDTLWGGEFLLATDHDFQRVASLRPIALPGGERAIREPWRVALSLLTDAGEHKAAVEWSKQFASHRQIDLVRRLTQRGVGPRCSSAGRLFDGVACIILNAGEARFEGELAMRLEAVCGQDSTGRYELPVDDSVPLRQLDWRPMIRQLLADRHAGESAGTMAMRFHRALAYATASIASAFNDWPVVLAGGCFQNRVLTELIAAELRHHSQPLGLPGIVPPNDGGLAAGQLAIGQAQLKRGLVTSKNRENESCA
ncbi:MAG: carbamoyltransferase HypF [Planctomycetaceae bacterium]|jgi:hydrogenase maturation protein HypF|nr:carbamoyltransferase HypF [Planctomycetaceae bacterium]